MGDGGDPQQRNSGDDQPEGAAQAAALEARVARLEAELAALRRLIAGEELAPAAVRRAPAAPLPPPMPALKADSESHSHSDAAAPEIPAERFKYTRAPAVWTPAPTLPPPRAAPRESRDSFEDRLGSQIFNRIAIVLLLIGTAYFLKLAVDRRWIVPSPTGRVIAGLVAGAALVLWSERFRRKGFAAFSYSLKAVGSGVLYLSLWAGFQLYHLLPPAVALALMILVTAWNAYMAWVQDAELLAAYALAGGLATPLLLSTGGNHEVFLFTYLLAIDLATVALVRLKTWPRLLLGAFPATVAFFIAWYAEYWAADELATTSIFILLFGAAFASVPFATTAALPMGRAASGIGTLPAPLAPRTTLLEDILQPLANAAFVALALYSVLQDSGHHALLPWLMLALAVAYLGAMRVPQTRTAAAIHLSLAVVFLTIAIPLKASGAWITASWLVEGLALLWVASRLAASDATGPTAADTANASRVLRPLALTALLLGFCGILEHAIGLADTADLSLWNKATGTALTGVAVFALAAWLALRAPAAKVGEERNSPSWRGIAAGAFVLIDLTAALLTLRELALSWQWEARHAPFQTADFFNALLGLAVFAGVVAVSLRVAAQRPSKSESFWIHCAALSTIAFNLIAVLTGVREIDAIWSSPTSSSAEAALQQALAISAYLMLYGATLLALGFWRRNEFLRWQALLLLVFTICKTFLYDMRNLSQGYRVVSILGLGVVLMAISFAYQKDWLNLREPKPSDHRDSDPEASR